MSDCNDSIVEAGDNNVQSAHNEMEMQSFKRPCGGKERHLHVVEEGNDASVELLGPASELCVYTKLCVHLVVSMQSTAEVDEVQASILSGLSTVHLGY